MLSFEEFKVLFDNADKRRKLSHASESSELMYIFKKVKMFNGIVSYLEMIYVGVFREGCHF